MRPPHASAAHCFRPFRHLHKIFVFEQQLAERVALMRVKAGRNDDQVGLEFRGNLADRRIKGASLIAGRSQSAQWQIQSVTAAAPDARFRRAVPVPGYHGY